MFGTLAENVVKPLIRRLAGQAAMALGATGFVTQSVENIEAAIIVLGGVVLDLLVRKVL